MSHIRGFFLIEILVSLFILAIMLLGMDALQISALRSALKHYYLVVARQQMLNATEILIACRGINSAQVQHWDLQNSEVLPSGHGVIRGDYPVYSIDIKWGKTACLHSEVSI